MSTRAKYVGAQGVVVDGCCRDLNEHRGMEFPVSFWFFVFCFARGFYAEIDLELDWSLLLTRNHYILGLRKGILLSRLQHIHESVCSERARRVYFARTNQTIYDSSW